jgi:uncharacterized protein (UPF0335 family)
MAEIRTSEEAKESIVAFANALIDLQLRKKEIDEDIKTLKDNFKEDGVPVGVVQKVINLIKSDKKKSDSELFEIETIKAWLETDKDFDSNLGELIAK